ncbi:MAG: DUF4249 domain-containing protein [Prolixibacteraceae bacterium]
MVRKYIQLLLFTILLVSCTKYIEYSPPYEGDKIVINGYISPTEGAKIKITHSINPVGNYLWADSLLIKDASAALYENGIKLIDLKYGGKGYYGLPDSPTVNLIAGHKYKLVVQSELYGKAESEEITLPEQPVINDFKFGETVKIYGVEYGIFSFSISEPNKKDTYFLLDAVTKNNESLFFRRYPWKDGEIYFESCQAYIGVLSVYSNECGFTNQEHSYALQIKYYDRNSNYYYKPIIIRIGTVSRELYEYAKNYSQLEGIELGFAEPPILKSNIKGGYGLLYGSNIVSYNIELP